MGLASQVIRGNHMEKKIGNEIETRGYADIQGHAGYMFG